MFSSLLDFFSLFSLFFYGSSRYTNFYLHIRQSIQEWTKQNFLKAAFHKFYLVHSWILCPIYIYIFIKLQSHVLSITSVRPMATKFDSVMAYEKSPYAIVTWHTLFFYKHSVNLSMLTKLVISVLFYVETVHQSTPH